MKTKVLKKVEYPLNTDGSINWEHKIDKDFIEEFINTVPLDIRYLGDKIDTVGVHWGYCQDADETYGRKTVLKVLDLLETDKEYQKLLA